MKTIAIYIREFLREEWNARYFLAVGLLLAALFVANYTFGLGSGIVKHLDFPSGQTGFYFIFYSVPYFLTHWIYALVKKDFSVFKTSGFWTLSVFALVVLAIYIVLHDGPWYLLKSQPALFTAISPEYQPIATRCASNILPLVFGGITLIVYWWKVDRDTMPLYGFSAKTIELRPYFLILLLLIPIVIAASFTSDFQHAYPRYKFGFPDHLPAGEQRMLIGLFEFCYGADFVFVEFLFRGFMILAFVRLIGPRAIIPMVVVYALIHFEKPLLEAISSIVGGLVLGVISYRTKSIYGGVILHLGVAMTMEIAGSLQMVSH
jgi:hypothetical protein